MKIRAGLFLVLGAWSLGLPVGCDSDRVGDPCVPEEEYTANFSGFAIEEVNTESRSFQCQTRLCLVNHFQGRVSCPYGQTQNDANGQSRCFVPDSQVPIRQPVVPQLLERRAEDAVYCSCRCDGPDPAGRYCECPSGFACVELVPKLSSAQQLAGSYCVREGTVFDGLEPAGGECDPAARNCEQ
jgi:hypothetical protein